MPMPAPGGELSTGLHSFSPCRGLMSSQEGQPRLTKAFPLRSLGDGYEGGVDNERRPGQH